MTANEVCKTKREKENSWINGNLFDRLDKAKLYAWREEC